MDNDQTNIKASILPKTSEIEYFTASDGLKLRVGFFPAHGQAKATILLIGGHREFLEKYGEFIGEFQSRGFNVYSFDLRGQGLSGRLLANRNKSHNPDFGRMVMDIDEIIDAKINRQTLNHPFYLVAHSMGSQLALRYVHDHVDMFDKAVLLSPFTEIFGGSALLGALIRIYAKTACALGLSKFFAPGQVKTKALMDHDQALGQLSHDQKRYNRALKAMEVNPDLFSGGVTYGWLCGVFKSIDIIGQVGYAKAIKTPLLCILSQQETVVDNKTTIRILQKAAKIEMIQGARHEIYFETDQIRELLWAKIDEFLGSSLG